MGLRNKTMAGKLVNTLVLTMWSYQFALGSKPCPKGTYLNLSSDKQCVPCSECRDDHIIRKPCTATTDTLCGPFYEFNDFNQDDTDDSAEGTATYSDVAHPGLKQQNNLDFESESDGVTTNYRTRTETPVDLTRNNDVIESTSEKWKELCFGLIGAMTAVTLLALLYVIIIHLRHRHGNCKHGTIADPESPVVYYHAQMLPHTPSPDRDSPLPNLENQLGENKKIQFLQRIFQPGATQPPHSNEYVEEGQAAKSNATPFRLHPINEEEIPDFPLAKLHRNNQQRLQRLQKQNQQEPVVHHNPFCSSRSSSPEAPTNNVAELLLSHHRCECDSS